MKKWMSTVLGLTLILALTACGAAPQTSEPAEKPVSIANPYLTYENAEQMQAGADLEVSLPENLPDWVTETIYRAIPGELAEVIYKGSTNEIRVRIKNGSQDISGVYDCDAAEEKDVTVGEYSVHLKGEKTPDGDFIIFVSTWVTAEGRTYSVTSVEGVSQEVLLPIIGQIR